MNNVSRTLIAVTGGIGSGKSVVCRLLRLMGYEVFDCDSEARLLTDSDDVLQRELRQAFGDGVFTACGTVDRQALAARVFGDDGALSRLNSIIHPAVTRRLLQWRQSLDAPVAFVETAILAESGLDQVVDCAWHVTAPEQVRVSRVMARSGLTPEQARSRIASQRNAPDEYRCPYTVLDNGGTVALMPQLLEMLDGLSKA